MYGWYSEKEAGERRNGPFSTPPTHVVVWEREDGSEVEVTSVTRTAKNTSDAHEDLESRGEVHKYVRRAP